MIRAIASAPGKAILFGEHAVVYGNTAIAAALSDLRISVVATYNPHPDHDHVAISLIFNDIKTDDGVPSRLEFSRDSVDSIYKLSKELTISRPTPAMITALQETLKFQMKDQLQQGVMSLLYLIVSTLPELFQDRDSLFSLSVEVTSQGLPIGAGLGSSAAFSVASAATLLLLHKKIESSFVSFSDLRMRPSTDDLYIINTWSYNSEIIIHGNPSGLDNYTSCWGGLVKFSKESMSFESILNSEDIPISILLTNTKVS